MIFMNCLICSHILVLCILCDKYRLFLIISIRRDLICEVFGTAACQSIVMTNGATVLK